MLNGWLVVPWFGPIVVYETLGTKLLKPLPLCYTAQDSSHQGLHFIVQVDVFSGCLNLKAVHVVSMHNMDVE